MKAVKNIKLVTNENMQESEGKKFLDAIYQLIASFKFWQITSLTPCI